MSDPSLMKIDAASSRLLLRTESETTFFIKSSTPFVAALKRIDRLLEKFDKLPTNYKQYQQGEYKKVKHLTVKALGAAMEKVVSVGLHFREHSGYQVDFISGTVNVVDQVKTKGSHQSRDDSDDEIELRGRNVSYIEAKIWLKRK
ncbi:ribonuclease P/MRP protein subunit POP7 [Metschnikowia aff. pulcherrima]|uniref:Ribonuclease P/MRP protein subunit POP7 n=1 Tax=Metschnikowia aff. pulcherrima TaxID=2163413 RepID=A0A4P6XDC1_9ASCO|nr:ribonuclease P/MRP protein subunit POP7 [Metschnikowia aff. pulcherrima]